MLDALEVHTREVVAVAEAAHKKAAKNSFKAYQAFRNKSGEFATFSILIEGRLSHLEGGADPRLQGHFDDLTALTYKLLIKTSIQFLWALAQHTELPLGTREIFVQELRTLYETRRTLAEPRYESRLDEDAKRKLHVAEEILTEIIDKAPSLLQFGTR
ncbi:MAG: hypothetical protein EXQ95_10345 [Alphaproteobacteria bacterium]|nr:hypothetical protein [Alphaproteobacteria bacterium]